MQSGERKVVVLGTGGTIAGLAANAMEAVNYRAGQVSVAGLIAAVPALAGQALEAEQLAQVDSKDMSHSLWQALARRLSALLASDDVEGAVVTHGTDTLEETAYFLHRVLAPSKPVVLTAAMRPASSLQADGPQNLFDAVTVARWSGSRGVLAVIAGDVYAAPQLRKAHPYRLDAFSGGEAGPLGRIEAGRFRRFRPWPEGQALGLQLIATPPDSWPRVEIVLNHVGADGRLVDALCAQGIDGLVMAGTGNGSLGSALEAAALRALASGVRVHRASRCADGAVIGDDDDRLPAAGALTAVQARVELLLECLAARPGQLRSRE